ncbi:MAG: hypothetical protein A2X36_03040 [Elusimicrobia bacterium GWA2_69_24]|nr:MAG: hypothetical protein A2X36_03040 [Elusimicrobia bacterium GWA2_69_24]HBL19236.1 hypothetical protein [Elusimicrobiota bacterium]
MKPTQYFSKEYLEHCRTLSPEQIVRFLEDFRLLHGRESPPARSRLISLKVPEPLLAAFKTKAQSIGIPYQTQIKRLMTRWLFDPD